MEIQHFPTKNDIRQIFDNTRVTETEDEAKEVQPDVESFIKDIKNGSKTNNFAIVTETFAHLSGTRMFIKTKFMKKFKNDADLLANTNPSFSEIITGKDVYRIFLESLYKAKRKDKKRLAVNDFKTEVLNGIHEITQKKFDYIGLIPLRFQVEQDHRFENISILKNIQGLEKMGVPTATLKDKVGEIGSFSVINFSSTTQNAAMAFLKEFMDFLESAISIFMKEEASLLRLMPSRYVYLNYFPILLSKEKGLISFESEMFNNFQYAEPLRSKYKRDFIGSLQEDEAFFTDVSSFKLNQSLQKSRDLENRLIMSVEWLGRVAREPDSKLQISYCTFALEAIFQTKDKSNGIEEYLKHNSVRTLARFGKSHYDSNEVYNIVHDAYQSRSDVVHSRVIGDVPNTYIDRMYDLDMEMIKVIVSFILDKNIYTLNELETYLFGDGEEN